MQVLCVCGGGILIIFMCVFRSDVTEWTNLGWCSFYLCSHTFWFSGVSALYVCVSQCRGMHFVQLNSNAIFRQFISHRFSMTFLDAILHNTECCNLFGLSDNLLAVHMLCICTCFKLYNNRINWKLTYLTIMKWSQPHMCISVKKIIMKRSLNSHRKIWIHLVHVHYNCNFSWHATDVCVKKYQCKRRSYLGGMSSYNHLVWLSLMCCMNETYSLGEKES